MGLNSDGRGCMLLGCEDAWSGLRGVFMIYRPVRMHCEAYGSVCLLVLSGGLLVIWRVVSVDPADKRCGVVYVVKQLHYGQKEYIISMITFQKLVTQTY